MSREGKAVIIHDQVKEELSLIRALLEMGAPVVRFTGNLDELPAQPLRGIRFILLDIVLNTSQSRKGGMLVLITVLDETFDGIKTMRW